jgi:sugar transferase (PEP-CTERM system associated)
MFTQLVIELSWLVVAALVAIHLGEQLGEPLVNALAPAAVFAILMVTLNAAFGVYRRHDGLVSKGYVLRLLLATAIAIPAAYAIDGFIPNGGLFQENVVLAAVLALGGLLVVRHAIALPLVGSVMPHRVLVLGTGPEARLVETSVAATTPPGLRLVGFYPLEKVQDVAVSRGEVVETAGSLEETVRRLGVDEIIVAVRQQRGGVLPLRNLLECRLQGVEITDLARFFERVHGKVPIELLKVSWLIYGNGYRQGWLRTAIKRLFDIVAALTLLVITLPVTLATTIAIALEGGFPVIYRQERVGRRGKVFTVFKFRSMAHNAEKAGEPRWAEARDPRVTRVGRFIRKARIDELPQLLNVLRGEMSFVGPRPERPAFVEMLTEQIPFYAVRHSVKPGLTGWAQVRYSYGATVEQSVRKLEYDLYYVKNHTLALDILILLETVRVVLLGEGAH